jgi:hypothetical protein
MQAVRSERFVDRGGDLGEASSDAGLGRGHATRTRWGERHVTPRSIFDWSARPGCEAADV